MLPRPRLAVPLMLFEEEEEIVIPMIAIEMVTVKAMSGTAWRAPPRKMPTVGIMRQVIREVRTKTK